MRMDVNVCVCWGIDTMSHMSEKDWPNFDEDVIGQVNVILDSDLESLRRMSEDKKNDLWQRITQNEATFENEYAARLPRDLLLNCRGKLRLAKLLLAAVAETKNEATRSPQAFGERELQLVENLEKFGIFEIMSAEEIADGVFRQGEIYNIVKNLFDGQYFDLDDLLDDPTIERNLKHALKSRYRQQLRRIEEGIQVCISKYGLLNVLERIRMKCER